MLSSLSGCSLIDDDLADCASTRTLSCRLHPYGDIDSLLAAQITGNGGQILLNTLAAYYRGLLYPSHRTVNFSFYDVASGELCTVADEDVAGLTTSFTISLPQSDLQCVAESRQPMYSGREYLPARQPRDTVNLYPTSAQVAVVAKIDSTITEVQMVADGCANAFNAVDSTYSFAERTDTLSYTSAASTASLTTYTGEVLPSNSTQPWRITVYATTASGSVTRTVFTMRKPLLPGAIRVLQIEVGGNGAANTSDLSVGASVTLDWKRGGQYDPEI